MRRGLELALGVGGVLALCGLALLTGLSQRELPPSRTSPATAPPSVRVPAPPDPGLDPLPALYDAARMSGAAGRDALVQAAQPLPVLVDPLFALIPDVARTLFASELLALHPATADSVTHFLSVYSTYTQSVNAALTAGGEAQAGGAGYGVHTRLRRRIAARYAGDYRRAMAAADTHLAAFRTHFASPADPTYLIVRKSEFVTYLVGERRNDIRAVFPVGVGAVRGPKARRGDLRTPECPPLRGILTHTPFFVGPLFRGDIVPNGGVITRGIGVDSRDPAFGFLERGWLIMFHGTPDGGSMGTRSSLGCIRMLPRHIELLFEHVRAGARVVITP